MPDINKIIQIQSNNIKPIQGRLLISEPFLSDYYFKRSIVAILDHTEDGTIGIVLNKEIGVKLSDVFKDIPKNNFHLYLGGPVRTDNLYYIHKIGKKINNSIHITEGIYWGGDLDSVKELIEQGQLHDGNIRFFLGYSGWAPLQLDEELKLNSWIVSRTHISKILSFEPSLAWNKTLELMGGVYKYWTNFPKDPLSN